MDREIAHPGLTELHVVSSMHERKALMADLSDAFVALPGGIGTLEELIEVYTWSQLRLHDKPLGVLNVAGYYDGLAAFLDHAVTEGFLPAAQRARLLTAAEPDALLDGLASARGPEVTACVDAPRLRAAAAQGIRDATERRARVPVFVAARLSVSSARQ